MPTPKQLMQRFPYMFSGRNIGIAIAKGWMPSFAKLCEDIDALLGEDKQGFAWVQVKEKFGSGRFYFRMVGKRSNIPYDGPAVDGSERIKTVVASIPEMEFKYVIEKDLLLRINDLVDAAQRQTEQICIVCGEAAAPDELDGHRLVLCARHQAQRHGAGDMESHWFEFG